MPRCPHCREQVRTSATVCPNCTRDIPPATLRKWRRQRLVKLGMFVVVGYLIVAVAGQFSEMEYSFEQTETQPDVATAQPNALEQAQEGLTVDRAWAETAGNYHCSYALITWQNKTGATFRSVTIQAIAYDPSGNKINTNQRSFFAHEHGPIGPGFRGTLKIPVELQNKEFSKMECSVSSVR